LAITLTPAQHWSSRTIGDRNLRLWGSFAITSPQHRVFFCGDTGYPRSFPLFRQIADTLGPFDLACIPIGAYTPSDLNREAHVSPMEAVQIHKDLMSRHSIAIHWGSFALGEEDMSEPPQALLAAMRSERTILPAFEALEHGGTIQINQSTTTVENSIESEHDASAGLRC
jgi:N-acyl-phosphatidylethanolamine-hydrolysing phospholipase D